MTRRRRPRTASERVVGALSSVAPGSLGGRVRNTRPAATSSPNALSATSSDGNGIITITQQAGNHTFTLVDVGTEVEGTSSTAQTFTIPPNSSIAFPVGASMNARQAGAGQLTVAAGTGVTLRAPNGAKAAQRYSTLGLIQRAVDEWVVTGDTRP